LLISIPGIGVLAASYLISFLPELGKLPSKAIASLVGLAPFNRDSGKLKGKRFIQGGRAQLRRKRSAKLSITHNFWYRSMLFMIDGDARSGYKKQGVKIGCKRKIEK
jgi:transposase